MINVNKEWQLILTNGEFDNATNNMQVSFRAKRNITKNFHEQNESLTLGISVPIDQSTR